MTQWLKYESNAFNSFNVGGECGVICVALRNVISFRNGRLYKTLYLVKFERMIHQIYNNLAEGR